MVCVFFSVEDIPEIIAKPHFILNKLLFENDPVAYQCMKYWHEE
jgi:hypothetical protein